MSAVHKRTNGKSIATACMTRSIYWRIICRRLSLSVTNHKEHLLKELREVAIRILPSFCATNEYNK